MQITPNNIGVNTSQPATVDPEIAQLINNLANKPLLIEKLMLNQTQGLLLKLYNNQQQLELQLPLQLSKAFNHISQQDTKISLSLNAQQIRLTLIPTKSETSNTTNRSDNSDSANNQILRPLIFQKAVLLSNRRLLLENPVQGIIKSSNSNNAATPSTLISAPSSNITASTTSTTSVKISSQQEFVNNPLQTILSTSSKASKLTKLLGNIAKSIKGQDALPVNKNEQVINTNTINNKITVGDAAKALLTQHFSKQLPLAQSLSAIIKMAKSFEKSEVRHPQTNQLINQVKQLLISIKKMGNPTGEEIQKRVQNSGHLLERNLARQFELLQTNNVTKIIETEPTPSKLELLKLELSKLDLSKLETLTSSNNVKNTRSHSIKTDSQSNQPSTNTQSSILPTSTNDLKLRLMLIRSTLESMIKSTYESIEKTPLPNTMQPAEKIIASLSKNVMSNQKKNQVFQQQSIIFKQATEMLTEVKNIVSQIETNQLLSLKNEQVNLQQFLVDLPLANKGNIDSFELLFEHSNKEHQRKSKKHWKVIVRFDLEPLGPMFAQVELQDERISTHIFAKSQHTAQLIDQHLHILKKSLFAAGVNVDQIKGSQGNIPEKLLEDNDRSIDTHV